MDNVPMQHIGEPSNSYGLHEIPRYVQYTSPVSTAPLVSGARAASLPLNLIALIVSYLDDVGDIARVTRTSRLLYYMALPQLYQRVTLRSYPGIQYVDGRPEGFGGGSPLAMALNGLVTKSHATLVKEFRIMGQWKDGSVSDFERGRIPDSTLFLNILLRAATDKMAKLQTLVWELDSKPLKTLYEGLGQHSNLTSLTIKFPSSRAIRPTVMIPPMPSLRAFKATDIDPLCYPDDMSTFFLHGERLEDVRLHFSPRMRREAEPTLSLDTYFGRMRRAGKLLRCRHFALHHFFGLGGEMGLDRIFYAETSSIAFIDCFGGAHGNAKNAYIDDTWRNLPAKLEMNFRRIRFNELAVQHVELLRQHTGMERFFYINAKHPEGALDSPNSPVSSVTPSDSSGTPTFRSSKNGLSQLARDYLHVLTHNHGSTLTHLLLPAIWALSQDDISEIVRYCPNLEQLGLAFNSSDHSTLRLLVPFLPRITAVHVLKNSFLDEFLRSTTDEMRRDDLSKALGKPEAIKLRWLGFGDLIYKIGRRFESFDEDGAPEFRREITVVSKEEAMCVDLWGMDVLNIDADPVLPFKP